MGVYPSGMATDPILSALNAKARELKAELDRVERTREAWLNGSTPGSPATAKSTQKRRVVRRRPGQLTTKDWIRKVLAERPMSSPTRIADRAVELGWSTTSNNRGTVVSNMLKDLVDAGEVTRDDNGDFRLAAEARNN
jgi:hypothetical protein